jgi:hypothetical protein
VSATKNVTAATAATAQATVASVGSSASAAGGWIARRLSSKDFNTSCCLPAFQLLAICVTGGVATLKTVGKSSTSAGQDESEPTSPTTPTSPASPAGPAATLVEEEANKETIV